MRSPGGNAGTPLPVTAAVRRNGGVLEVARVATAGAGEATTGATAVDGAVMPVLPVVAAGTLLLVATPVGGAGGANTVWAKDGAAFTSR